MRPRWLSRIGDDLIFDSRRCLETARMGLSLRIYCDSLGLLGQFDRLNDITKDKLNMPSAPVSVVVYERAPKKRVSWALVRRQLLYPIPFTTRYLAMSTQSLPLVEIRSLKEDSSRVPHPSHRHAAPSAPWPWIDLDDGVFLFTMKDTCLGHRPCAYEPYSC